MGINRDRGKNPSKMRPFVFLLIAAASATAKPYDVDEWGNCMAMCKGDIDCEAGCDTYLSTGSGAGWDDGLDYSGSGGDFYGTGSGWDFSGSGSGWDNTGSGAGWDDGMDYSGSSSGWDFSGSGSGSGSGYYYDYV